MFTLMSIHHPRPEHREAYERLAPAARAAVADDPFDLWEEGPIDGLRLSEV